MLSQAKIQRYKSLYEVTIDFEPLTVLIGPNGSGKSNVCEALLVASKMLQHPQASQNGAFDQLTLQHALSSLNGAQDWKDKHWQGRVNDPIRYTFSNQKKGSYELNLPELSMPIEELDKFIYSRNNPASLANALKQNKNPKPPPDWLQTSLNNVAMYDFSPVFISRLDTKETLSATGEGIANTLADILLDNQAGFAELSERFTALVPNIARISLKHDREQNYYLLRLADKYSDHLIPASDISDGTLRLLAFLTALYDVNRPSMVCFEEPENGVHPWLLHKMVDLLNTISTEGIMGKPVQVIITTHSPVLLNHVQPEQVRAVELDSEGKTKIHSLPLESPRFQATLDAYDGELGELWYTNLFGGNPA